LRNMFECRDGIKISRLGRWGFFFLAKGGGPKCDFFYNFQNLYLGSKFFLNFFGEPPSPLHVRSSAPICVCNRSLLNI
jgi:hypothetical protein